MKTSFATITNISPISNLLVDRFQKINTHFGYNRYKTNLERIQEVVSERINDKNSPYKYLVLQNEREEFVGFINLLFSKDVCEILLISVYPEYDTYDNIKLLFDEGLKLLRIANPQRIITELTDEDVHFKQLLREMNSKIIMNIVSIN